ncbi:MAG: hypothetical protein IPM82_16465 [Saprospiraceae bacterium]|nr:hypothetical protein [Saprospiraceae bacterium]
MNRPEVVILSNRWPRFTADQVPNGTAIKKAKKMAGTLTTSVQNNAGFTCLATACRL